MIVWLRENAVLPKEAGGKAMALQRLHRAGLRTANGFVVLPMATREQVSHALQALGAETLVVRSSATVEDQPGRRAPGVFRSENRVAPQEVFAAVERVRASLHEPLAQAYFGQELAGASMSVLVQEDLLPERTGTVYTRAPMEPDAVLIERHHQGEISYEKHQRNECSAAEARLALAAEKHLGLAAADVEWGWSQGQCTIFQARPAPPVLDERPQWNGPMGTWHWDRAHNPLPLSPAQQQLVELVAKVCPWKQTVINGYLFVKDSPKKSRRVSASPWQEYTQSFPRLRSLCAAVEQSQDLAEGQSRYVDFFAYYANTLVPLLHASENHYGRIVLDDNPALRDGMDAPARWPSTWDVADPLLPQGNAPAVSYPDASPAEQCAWIRQHDDRWFARAQNAIGTLLRRRAHELGLPPDDAAYAALEDEARPSAAQKNRALRDARCQLAVPLKISDGSPIFARQSHAGLGGRYLGVIGDPEDFHNGEVLQVASLHPGYFHLLKQAGAVIAEHGSLLCHGAALAQELKIPCVLGYPPNLDVGQRVLVDGQRALRVEYSD